MTAGHLFTSQASLDVDEAAGWLLDHGARPETAAKLLRAVLLAAERLGSRPLLGRRQPGLVPDPFRIWSVPAQRVIMIYNPDTRPVRILRVLHTARDLPNLQRNVRLE